METAIEWPGPVKEDAHPVLSLWEKALLETSSLLAEAMPRGEDGVADVQTHLSALRNPNRRDQMLRPEAQARACRDVLQHKDET